MSVTFKKFSPSQDIYSTSMKGIKTVAANLANRICQPHYVEGVLRMVFTTKQKTASTHIQS